MIKAECMTEVRNVEAAGKLKTRARHDRWLILIGGVKLLIHALGALVEDREQALAGAPEQLLREIGRAHV